MTGEPYELLARFGRDGKVSGVSARTIETVGGRDYESDPFPLDGIDHPAFVGFAVQFSAGAVAERDAAVKSLTEATAALAPLTAERDAARAEVVRLTEELEALRNPTDSQGFPVLSAVQLRLGIVAAGIPLANIDGAIAAIPDETTRTRVETYWQFATEFHRDHPLIAGMVAALGLTTEQADALWRAAGSMRWS